MEKGFNSDISVAGVAFHIQTQDWGRENPYVVTQIFKGGAILRSVKTPYEEIWRRSPRSDQHAIRLAMQLQHQEILDQLLASKVL